MLHISLHGLSRGAPLAYRAIVSLNAFGRLLAEEYACCGRQFRRFSEGFWWFNERDGEPGKAGSSRFA